MISKEWWILNTYFMGYSMSKVSHVNSKVKLKSKVTKLSYKVIKYRYIISYKVKSKVIQCLIQ